MNKQQLRKKADILLQDYIRLKYKGELCWVCGQRPITCGHHFFPVSNCMATRYYLPNIIPICTECHCLAHSRPHLVNPKICYKLGQSWYDDLIETKRQGVKFNKEWITTQYQILQELYKEIS